MFRSSLAAAASALLIGLTACGGDDGASVRNIGEPCPTSSPGSATAASATGSATAASGSGTGTHC